jgi:hypothetical protein
MSWELIILSTSAIYLLAVIFGLLILLRFRLEPIEDPEDEARRRQIEQSLTMVAAAAQPELASRSAQSATKRLAA